MPLSAHSVFILSIFSIFSLFISPVNPEIHYLPSYLDTEYKNLCKKSMVKTFTTVELGMLQPMISSPAAKTSEHDKTLLNYMSSQHS